MYVCMYVCIGDSLLIQKKSSHKKSKKKSSGNGKLTHSLHSLTHSLTHPLTPLTHSLTHSLTPLTHSLTHSLTYSLPPSLHSTRSLAPSFSLYPLTSLCFYVFSVSHWDCLIPLPPFLPSHTHTHTHTHRHNSWNSSP